MGELCGMSVSVYTWSWMHLRNWSFFQAIQELQSFKAADNVELMLATEAPITYTVVASAKALK